MWTKSVVCVEENEILGHASGALGVLVWHKGMHKPILSSLSLLTQEQELLSFVVSS